MAVKLSTRAQAVKALGLPSSRALDKLIEKGAPAPAPGKRGSARYDVAAIEAWRLARRARVRPVLDLATERAALANVQTKLARLKLREARGELVKAADAEEVLRLIATATRAAVLAIPRRAVLAGVPREHEATLKALVTEALRDLSETKTLAGLGKLAAREDVA